MDLENPAWGILGSVWARGSSCFLEALPQSRKLGLDPPGSSSILLAWQWQTVGSSVGFGYR